MTITLNLSQAQVNELTLSRDEYMIGRGNEQAPTVEQYFIVAALRKIDEAIDFRRQKIIAELKTKLDSATVEEIAVVTGALE